MMKGVTETLRDTSESFADNVAIPTAEWWHRHLYVLVRDPRRNPGRIQAPPTPDTDPIKPLPGSAIDSAFSGDVRASGINHEAFNQLLVEIDAALGGSAVGHSAEVDFRVPDYPPLPEYAGSY